MSQIVVNFSEFYKFLNHLLSTYFSWHAVFESWRDETATCYAETECTHSCLCQQSFYRNNLRNTALATYGKTNLRLEPLKWQNEIWLWTACSKTGRAVLVCVPNWLLTTFVDAVQIYGNSNEWMGLHTNIFLSTDHLPATYRAPTEHLPSTFLWCSLFTITGRLVFGWVTVLSWISWW